jgi:hypothetical protein
MDSSTFFSRDLTYKPLKEIHRDLDSFKNEVTEMLENDNLAMPNVETRINRLHAEFTNYISVMFDQLKISGYTEMKIHEIMNIIKNIKLIIHEINANRLAIRANLAEFATEFNLVSALTEIAFQVKVTNFKKFVTGINFRLKLDPSVTDNILHVEKIIHEIKSKIRNEACRCVQCKYTWYKQGRPLTTEQFNILCKDIFRFVEHKPISV